MAYYINRRKKHADIQLGFLLRECILNTQKNWEELVFLCIGSDRITGDSLGPYIGYQLSQYMLPHTNIYGTLETTNASLVFERARCSKKPEAHTIPVM